MEEKTIFSVFLGAFQKVFIDRSIGTLSEIQGGFEKSMFKTKLSSESWIVVVVEVGDA